MSNQKKRKAMNLKLIVISISLLFLFSCGDNSGEATNEQKFPAADTTSAGVPRVKPEASIVTEVNQIAALAFIAYAGDDLDNTEAKADYILEGCVSDELSRQPLLNNRYSLAWGPSVYKLKLADLDDNMMYAVNDKEEPGHIIISIRGTNPKAILDWFVEDFHVNKTTPWRYSNSVSSSVRISNASAAGLEVLQGLKGKIQALPTSTLTIIDYLTQRSANNSLTKVTVTGHSLAGALAPVFALWLKDTESSWNQSASITINVLPIAGATSGNADFASYYDKRLGTSTNRLHNPYDVVPQAWYIPSMRNVPKLYVDDQYNIVPGYLESSAFDVGIELAKNKNYTQIKQNQAALPGVINPNATVNGELTFVAQARWQHHCGYYNALGITHSVYKVNSLCVTKRYCLDNPGDSACVALGEYLCDAVPITQ